MVFKIILQGHLELRIIHILFAQGGNIHFSFLLPRWDSLVIDKVCKVKNHENQYRDTNDHTTPLVISEVPSQHYSLSHLPLTIHY